MSDGTLGLAAGSTPVTILAALAPHDLRWQAQVVTEIVALAAIAPVPVVTFEKLQ